MKCVFVNTESFLLGEAIALLLHRNGDFQTIQESDPRRVAESAFLAVADVLLMEVTGHERFQLETRLEACKTIRRRNPRCRIALLINETVDGAAAEKVKQAKVDGRIDEFIYDTAGARYMAALLETLGGEAV